MECIACNAHFCWGCLRHIDDCLGTSECDEQIEAYASEYSDSEADDDALHEASDDASTPLTSPDVDGGKDEAVGVEVPQGPSDAAPATQEMQGTDTNNVQAGPRRPRRRDLDVVEYHGGDYNFGDEPGGTSKTSLAPYAYHLYITCT